MKKILFIIIMLLFSINVYAGQKTVTIQWDQTFTSEANKPVAYDLYYSFNGIPSEITKTFNFDDSVHISGNTYEYTFNITGEDGTSPTLSIALTAWNNDNSGNKQTSVKSNIATEVIDFPIIYVIPNSPEMIMIKLSGEVIQ